MGNRDHVFWASPDPPLTYSKESISSSDICAMYGDRNDKNAFVIAAGTDQKIRYWNLTKPELSRILVGSGNEKLPYGHTNAVRYHQSLIDGICVVREQPAKPRSARSSTDLVVPGSPKTTAAAMASAAKSAVFLNDPPKSCLDPVMPGHRDWITSLILCSSKKNQYLISADRDGIIKVWK